MKYTSPPCSSANSAGIVYAACLACAEAHLTERDKSYNINLSTYKESSKFSFEDQSSATDNNLPSKEGGDICNRQALSLVLASFDSTVSPMNWFHRTEPDKGREFQKSMLFRSIR